MRLLVVTDAWSPQVNGVVNSLESVLAVLRGRGDEVRVISPDLFRTLPCPTYPEIRLALPRPGELGAKIKRIDPNFTHIATEGPLGILARRWCIRNGVGFTTSYHTKFPEYVSARAALPLAWGYALMRRFHNAALGCMVATQSLHDDLAGRGFRNLLRWSRGVDHALFRPRPGADLGLVRPVFLYVGRVAVEKNIEAFLRLRLPGSKLVVGDGPSLPSLARAYPDAVFRGVLRGEELARAYAGSDVLVFPSITDTFGNVILEALASGLPVAAFPVTGPKDILIDERVGALDDSLAKAALAALGKSGEQARLFSYRFSWEKSAEAFRANVLSAHGAAASAPA